MFQAALKGEDDKHPFIPSLRGVAHDLIRLALCVTAEVVAWLHSLLSGSMPATDSA